MSEYPRFDALIYWLEAHPWAPPLLLLGAVILVGLFDGPVP